MNYDILISHPEEKGVPAKPLKTHLRNVASLAHKQISDLRLSLTTISTKELAKLAWTIGLFHDFGKATTCFQKYIRKKRKSDNLTHHSFISAVVCYHAVKKEFDHIWAIAAYMIVKRHHNDLETIRDDECDAITIAGIQLKNILENNAGALKDIYSDFEDAIDFLEDLDIDSFDEEIETFQEIVDEYGDDENQKTEFFFVISLLFSVLTDNDKKDAARLDNRYFEGNLDEGIDDVFDYIDTCRKINPEKFNQDIPINKIRNQFLDEIRTNEQIHPDNHFYSVTAPTGIGKTFGCLAFANKLKEQLGHGEGRIIYCLPYTSIIDQNFDEFEKIIKYSKGEKYENRPSRYLLKHHYLEFKQIKNRIADEEYSYKDYMDDRLFVESWESSLIVTTFVQFFHTIIGYKNRFLKKFHNIVNSIVILDEVQNIDPEYYSLLRSILHVLGKRFNIYFLLITATQPEILDRNLSKPVEIVQSEKYMKAALFNRVNLKIISNPMTPDEFKEYFCSSFAGENCLIVMNTKQSVIELYEHISEEKDDYEVYCLTTRLTPSDRRKKIKIIRQKLEDKQSRNKIIVVATQLIEAGVDLSFKFVYRDFSPFDSIVQVAGRCNRNGEYGELGGEMTLLNLVRENSIPFHSSVYNPILSQHVKETVVKDCYQSRDFFDLTKTYFEKFCFNNVSRKLQNSIYELNYDDENIKNQIPVKNFKLIKTYDDESLHILTTQDAQSKMDRLIELRKNLFKNEVDDDEKWKILYEIEKIKGVLSEFRISVKSSELIKYNDSNIIKGDEYLRYISFKDQKQYAYDENTGFQVKPKELLCGTINF